MIYKGKESDITNLCIYGDRIDIKYLTELIDKSEKKTRNKIYCLL